MRLSLILATFFLSALAVVVHGKPTLRETADTILTPRGHAALMESAHQLLDYKKKQNGRRLGVSKASKSGLGGAETGTRKGGCGRLIAKNDGVAVEVTNGEVISFMDDGDDDRIWCTEDICAGDGEAMMLYQGKCENGITVLEFTVLKEGVDRNNDEVRFWCPSLKETADLTCTGDVTVDTETSGPIAEVDVPYSPRTGADGTADCVLTCTPPDLE